MARSRWAAELFEFNSTARSPSLMASSLWPSSPKLSAWNPRAAAFEGSASTALSASALASSILPWVPKALTAYRCCDAEGTIQYVTKLLIAQNKTSAPRKNRDQDRTRTSVSQPSALKKQSGVSADNA